MDPPPGSMNTHLRSETSKSNVACGRRRDGNPDDALTHHNEVSRHEGYV